MTGVVTLDGHAVRDAVVTLTALQGLDAPDGPYRQEPNATVTTGADGRFTLPLDVTQAIVDLADDNSGYVNFVVQAHHNDITANPVIDAISDAAATIQHTIDVGEPPSVPTVPDLQALVDALVDLIGPIKIGGDDPIPNVDTAAIVRLAEGAIALATDLIGQLPPLHVPTVAELVQILTDLVGETEVPDPYQAVFGVPGKAYSAADFAYAQLIVNTNATSPAEELVGLTMSTPDPVSLELTALSATRGLVDEAGNPTGDDDDECRPRYAPYVIVEGRETSYQPVGEAHVRHDMKANFDYGETANTDLNGAYSFGGSSWKASAGANHMGNKQSLVRKWYDEFQSYVMETGFRYRKERLEFTDDMGDGRVCRIDYRVVPEGWVAGVAFGQDVSQWDSGGQMDAARGKGWATWFETNSEYIKKTSRGMKYTIGVEAFGVKLFSQSTWSTNVDVHYKFGPEGDHWLYGSNGDINSAENVYAW